MSDELVAMTESPQLTTRLLSEHAESRMRSVEPVQVAPQSYMYHPAKPGQENCGEEALMPGALDRISLSPMRCLGHNMHY